MVAVQATRQAPADGHTVLLTTHYLAEAEQLCDRIAIVDHGKIVARADFPDLVAQQNVWLTALNGVGKVETARPVIAAA